MTKKNVLLKLLVFCSAICMALCAFTFIPKQTLAATDLPSVTTIYMSEGAEVRLKSTDGEYKDVTGIRFTMLVNKDYYDELTDSKLTIYVDEATVKTEADMKDSAKASTSRFTYNCEKLVTHAAGEKAQEAVYSFNAVVAGLPSENFGTKLIANGCIKVGNSEPVFATNPQTRSISQVASSALADNIADDEFGTLKSYVDGAVDVSNFKFGNTSITTDLYKTAEPTVNATIPENLTPIWTSSDTEVATVNQNGEITRGEKLGTTTITAKLGTIIRTATVTVGEPNVITPNSVNWTNFKYASGTNQSYVDYVGTASSITGISGDYNGNAVKYKAFNTYKDNYTLLNTYTQAELTAIKNSEKYNAVSMWVAVDPSIVSVSWRNAGTYSADVLGINFREKADGVSTTVGVWQKWTVTIDEYIELVAAHDYAYLTLFAPNPGTASSSSDNTKWGIYVGDVSFTYVKADPAILTVNSNNYKNFKYATATSTNYIDYAGEASALTGISGDYTGNAVKYKAFNTYKDNYTVINSLSNEQLTAMKKDYNSVSMWVAVDPSIVSVSWRNAGTYSADVLSVNFREKADGVSTTVGVWQKWTVTIDEYIELVAAHDYAYLTLFAPNPGTVNSSSDNTKWGIYVGDIFFENV